MKKTFLILMLALALPYGLQARKQKLRHKVPAQKVEMADSVPAGPVAADSAMLRTLLPGVTLSGYDRNYGKTTETFLVSNSNPVPIAGVEVEITYTDLSGRMLHRRRATAMADVPAGETRLVELRAPDRQGTMYYYKSKAPRKGGMPYRVSIGIIKIFLNSQSQNP